MRPATRTAFALPAILAALASAALADRVRLANGEVMEGIVEEESSTQVTINLGVGSITMPRSRVVDIQQSATNETARIREEWQRRYFSHARFAPAGLEGLAKAFNELEALRREAVAAQGLVRRIQHRRAEQLVELHRLEQQAVAISRQLKGASPEQDVTNYNAVVRRGNEAGAEALALRDALQHDYETAEKQRAIIPEYLAALHAFSLRLDEQKKQKLEGNSAKVFFAEVERRLADFELEFVDMDIPFENDGGHMVVTALINDRVSGRFLLDTGASLLTMSDELAAQLDLALPVTSTMKMVVADGRKMDARPVILSSVRVGDAVVSNVASAVVDARPAPGLDGLLGMSFLREFLIRLDPARDKLVLEKFTPQ
jgi:clan AA aspartic protease (TIGR02281 family)